MQELQNHRVTAIDPFEDDGGIERTKPADDVFEPETGGDNEVVEDGEGEDEPGFRAVFEGGAFCSAPAETGGGIGNVVDEWQDAVGVCFGLAANCVEESVDGGVIGVECSDVAEFSGDAGEGAEIAAEVPGDVGFESAADFVNEVGFNGVIGGYVGSCLLVVRPCGVFGLPGELGDDFFQPGEVVEDHVFAEAGIVERLADGLADGLPGGVAAGEEAVKPDVRESTGAQEVAEAEEV